MPRARTEAQRRAERKYDQKKREVRGENWMIIVYPESVPDGWLDVLNELHVQITISPLHDSDVNADGELKKPHYHVLLMFESMKSLSQMKEIADALNAPAPQKQDSKRGAARYQCHLDNPEKAQYSVDDVLCLGGADYRLIISMANDKYEVISELLDWIDANTEIHRWAFSAVLRWCRENNEKWFRGLCDNCGWVIKEYLQSGYWEKNQTVDEILDKSYELHTLWKAEGEGSNIRLVEMLASARDAKTIRELADEYEKKGVKVWIMPPKW